MSIHKICFSDNLSQFIEFFKDQSFEVINEVSTDKKFGRIYEIFNKDQSLEDLNKNLRYLNTIGIFTIKKYGDLDFETDINNDNEIQTLSEWVFELSDLHKFINELLNKVIEAGNGSTLDLSYKFCIFKNDSEESDSESDEESLNSSESDDDSIRIQKISTNEYFIAAYEFFIQNDKLIIRIINSKVYTQCKLIFN